MSDQEKESGLTTPVVVVDQTEGGPIKPFHTANPQNNPEHQTRSKAPSLPSIPGDLVKTKSGGPASFINQNKPKVENKSAPPPVPEKQIPTPAPPVPEKQIPTPTKRPSIVDEGNREHLNSIVTLATLQVDSKRSNLSSPQQPIPPSTFPDESVTKDDKQDEDSMNDVVPELPPQKRYDWSDEEMASGLPRSQSRASRVSRAVRQLFCCGVKYSAPSEDNVSTPSERYAL